MVNTASGAGALARTRFDLDQIGYSKNIMFLPSATSIALWTFEGVKNQHLCEEITEIAGFAAATRCT